MKIILILTFSLTTLISGCEQKGGLTQRAPEKSGVVSSTSSPTQQAPYINLEVADFLDKAKNTPGSVILDVRTPEETAQGMIPGALTLDFYSKDFKDKVDQLDKEQTYFVYCRSGGRSVNSCEMMKDLGFERLYNLVGGYNAYSTYKK